MSKQESLARHSIIIKSLRKRPHSFEEILHKLEEESELQDMRFEISKRTFQRDLKEIETLYQIYIKYDRGQKSYKIAEDHQDDYSERLFEALDIFQVLNLNQSYAQFIQFDTRKPMGTEHLSGFVYAIQNRFQVQFRYQKFYETDPEIRTVEPYLLKEYRKRWYVFAYDLDKKEFRTFGLDRLYALNITQTKFQHAQKIDPNEYFENSFGIIGPGDRQVEDIKLVFTQNQGNYVRTMPLHKSQKITSDKNGEMHVELRLIPTYDFLMEILFHGEYVKIIEPKSLKDAVKDKLQRMMSIYQ
jgi:predicted DNA-binding transcriptional regulator YafY